MLTVSLVSLLARKVVTIFEVARVLVLVCRVSAAHLPLLDAHLLSALQTREHSQTVLVVTVELERMVLRRLVSVARDVHIIIIVETGDIPVVHLHRIHRLV